MILGALDDAGGVAYLKAQADKNPAAFMGLLGRILPTQLAHSGHIETGILKAEYMTDEQIDVRLAELEAKRITARAASSSGLEASNV